MVTSSSDTPEIVVIGAGAAGLFTATRAAQRGKEVVLLEKNTKPGVKILMSGGTRCNLTHATDRQGIADAFPREQSRFLRSPLAALGPEDLVDLFHREGLPTKVEPTGKVFPQSDRALDVQRTLLTSLHRSGARLSLAEGVQQVEKCSRGFRVQTAGRVLECKTLVIATGGQSYPGCGTTGDGYAWAKSLGHSIVPPRPALVPLKTTDSWAHELSGLTLPDIELSVLASTDKRPQVRRRGSLLLTHFGLSGPLAMDISRVITLYPRDAELQLHADLLPDQSEQQLLAQLAALEGRRPVASLVSHWLPKRLVEALFLQARVPGDRLSAELSKVERTALVQVIKRCRFHPCGSMGFAKAEVTAGGVALDEVRSSDMQSRQTPDLYLVGEVLDIDGPIGGYNFQAAFSTGWLAGDRV